MSLARGFETFGYAVIPHLLPRDEAAELYDYTLKNIAKGNLDDGQVPGSPSFYQDPRIVPLQKKLLPVIEKTLGIELLSVFCYRRVYRKGAVLRMHKDSTRAEISVSINLGQQGEPWDLWLVDYDENAHPVRLLPGDALVYFGSRLYHWRGKLVDADYVSQIMFHCVDAKGKNRLAAKTEIFRKLRKKIRELFGIAY